MTNPTTTTKAAILAAAFVREIVTHQSVHGVWNRWELAPEPAMREGLARQLDAHDAATIKRHHPAAGETHRNHGWIDGYAANRTG